MKYFFAIHTCLLQPLCCFALESNLSNGDLSFPSMPQIYTESTEIETGDYINFKQLMSSENLSQSSESPDQKHLSPYLKLATSDLESKRTGRLSLTEEPLSSESSEGEYSEESELSNKLDENNSQSYNDDEWSNDYVTYEDLKLIEIEHEIGLSPMTQKSTTTTTINDLILKDIYTELNSLAEYIHDTLVETEKESISIQVEKKFLSLLNSPSFPMIERLKNLDIFTQQVNQLPDGNVHVFDPQAASIAENLNGIGDWLEVAGKPNLSLAQVGQEMQKFIDERSDFFKDYSFQDMQNKIHSLPLPQIKNYISSHFLTMDNEIGNCPLSRAIWSRSWTLSHHLLKEEFDFTGMRFLFDTVVENYVTNGGCIQGRINRGLILYARLLRTLGIGVISN